MGYWRIGLEILGLKMLFIEIHICLASLHLAWTTTYAWSRWSRLVISNFLLLPSVFAVFSRLDSFYTTSTQRILYVSRLFLVSLVPWIDKPWGNILREKLHDPVRLRYINWGAKERQQAFLAPLAGIGNSNPRAIYLVFWTNPNFYYCIYPYFLVCVLESGGKS